MGLTTCEAEIESPPNFHMLGHAALFSAPVHSDPYVYFVAENVLTAEAGAAIRADFPLIK